jgi:F-box/leucine-rich repeat protein 2/20
MDEGVMELAERCPGLRNVCISNCSHLTDQSLVALATHCTGLVTLECTGLSHFTDGGFQVIVPPWMSSSSPQALVRSCHRLERLDLEECVLLTDASISQVPDVTRLLTSSLYSSQSSAPGHT